MTKAGIIALVLGIIGLAVYFQKDNLMRKAFEPRVTQPIVNMDGPDTQMTAEEPGVVAENLNIPWEIRWLPSGEILVTERPGRLLLIGNDRQVIEIEGGLMGLALHPDFADNNLIYLYLTARENGQLVNRVERYRLEGSTLTDWEVVVEGILGANNHDGGRIDFGPDGKLYIATGDAQQPQLAQDINSLNGKILRADADGSNLEVYSYGHRNVQGLAWDSQGRLWATEHGPSGTGTGFDEVNLIVAGGNYGWPEIQGDETVEGMITPVIQSGADDTWAPAGMAIRGDKLYFVGLRGETLYEAQIDGDNLTNLTRNFTSEFGRLRALRVGADNQLYVTTSNRDGRGSINDGDDKLIRLSLDKALSPE
jgi:glucose/arabinose dehydrogenase